MYNKYLGYANKFVFLLPKHNKICILQIFVVSLSANNLQNINTHAMTNKELYAEWCKTQPNLPVFMQPWWMDAVCAGKTWDVMLHTDAGGHILAALPYLIRKKWRFQWILMPQLTQIGGIQLTQDADGNTLVSNENIQAVCEDFARQMDTIAPDYCYQHYAINSACAPHMQSLGFTVKPRVTYRIEDLNDLDAVIERFSKNKKRQLQKALSLHAERGISAEEFYRCHYTFLLEKKKHISYTRELLVVLDRKARRNGQAETIAIKNADGETLAAAYLVWDNTTLYYLIPCFSPVHKDSGAGALLVLEAIKMAREKHLAFDFEGSMVHSIANHYKQFGSTPYRYYSVERYYNRWFRLAIWWNRLRNHKYGM